MRCTLGLALLILLLASGVGTWAAYHLGVQDGYVAGTTDATDGSAEALLNHVCAEPVPQPQGRIALGMFDCGSHTGGDAVRYRVFVQRISDAPAPIHWDGDDRYRLSTAPVPPDASETDSIAMTNAISSRCVVGGNQ
jgi:hypothetical protein